MIDELKERHETLRVRWSILQREYNDGEINPLILKLYGRPQERTAHVVWSELYNIIIEMDTIALQYYGAGIGDTVRLIGKRYGGALATIEGIEKASWYGQRFTRLGRKPRIKVTSPNGRSQVLISGHLWELVGKDF
jgi:hypothetical protein